MTTSHDHDATRADRVRQVSVAIGAALAIAAAAWGAGAFGGTPIAEAADGALAADATLLAPASAAFSIWSVIYAGLAFFAIYQALPRHGNDPRLRAVAWPILISMILNAAWIATVQAGWLWVSVLVIALLVGLLARIAVMLVRMHPPGRLAVAATDVPVGLYLGWVSVATAANIAAAGRAALGASADDGAAYAAVTLIAVGAIAITFSVAARSRTALTFATGLAMAWGLFWIAFGRTAGEPSSLLIMWCAGLAAIAAFCAPYAALDFSRGRRSRVETRA